MKQQVDQRISTSSHAHSDYFILFYLLFYCFSCYNKQMENKTTREDKICENVAIFKQKECVCVLQFK
jgi:hypothetical protein